MIRVLISTFTKKYCILVYIACDFDGGVREEGNGKVKEYHDMQLELGITRAGKKI